MEIAVDVLWIAESDESSMFRQLIWILRVEQFAFKIVEEMSHLFGSATYREIVDIEDVRDAEVHLELEKEVDERCSILLELSFQQLLRCESMISIGTYELTSKSFCDLRFFDVHEEYLAFE